VAVSSRGDRSFLHLVGANGRVIPDDVDDGLLARSKILHLGGYFILPFLDGEPAAGLLRRAKAAGCRTSLDTAWDARGRWMDALAPCLQHLDLLFGNREELARVTGEDDPSKMTGALRQSGVEIVAVKLGEDGAFVEGDGWRGHVPAFAVPVVDTTGAGDAFCGGFLRGYLAGWNLEQTTRFANAVGGMCVTAVGGATGIRGTDETLAFMRQTRPRG
jgi:sugar/nucleoside kinase (ribokinase family)